VAPRSQALAGREWSESRSIGLAANVVRAKQALFFGEMARDSFVQSILSFVLSGIRSEASNGRSEVRLSSEVDVTG
jgi:hypothetical protein